MNRKRWIALLFILTKNSSFIWLCTLYNQVNVSIQNTHTPVDGFDNERDSRKADGSGGPLAHG